MRTLKYLAKARVAATLGMLIAFAPAAFANFYDVAPAELAGKPGSLIRSEVVEHASIGTVYRILYRSTGLSNEPIAVSGLVVVPLGAASAKGRDVIAWAHPTTGIAQPCAPSLARNVLDTIPGLASMLKRGFVVAATDYPGLGTVGPHPYLVGESAGRAVLDSVRAARALRNAGAGGRFAVWGHSQGGHAALFAGEIAKAYTPELHLVGVAAAAPAVELAALVESELGTTSGKILVALALWSWSKVYDAPLDEIVEPSRVASVNRIAKKCVEGIVEVLSDRIAAYPLRKDFLAADPTATEPWRSIIARNTPGQVPPGAPLFIARGTADIIVPAVVSADFVAKRCRAGARVQILTLEAVRHRSMAHDSAAVAVDWMAERFAGAPPPSSCGE